MRFQNKAIKELLYIAVGLFAAFLIMFNDNGNIDSLIGYCTIAVSILTMVKVRHNWYLLFIFFCIAYSNYSICVANYVSHINTFFAGYAGTEIGSHGINILLLFSAMLLIITPRTRSQNPPSKWSEQRSLIVNNNYNPIIVIGAIIILALIWVYGFTRPDAIGQRGSPSALYEYSIIFLIVAFYFSGKDKKLIVATVLVGLAYALQNFIFGGRITGIQILIMIVFAIYIDQLRVRSAIPVGVVFFVIMSAIGQLRGAILASGLNVRNVIIHLANSKYALDTAYSSYYTSMTFLDELSNITFFGRIHLFERWVLSMFVGGSVTDSNLAIYTRQTHMHYYGGVLPFFAWFYLGFIGLILLVAYLRLHFYAILRVNSDSTGLARCIVLYVTCTCLRWYLYSPSQLFRGVLLLCLVYCFCYGADRLMRRKRIYITWKA